MGEVRTLRSLIEIVQVVEDCDDVVYVRYSRGPEADAHRVSRDFEAEVDLPGLSVSTLTPPSWWTRSTVDWVARRLCKYLDLGKERGNRPWLLVGREVGTGPDHEPLVVDPTPLGRVSDAAVDEARRHYAVAFRGDGLKDK
ncbi:DUF6098 family protein [Microlunatus parietis]|uniref:Uncharacterized protein n=1 Tax=Microlunatus parietis TaxID=682979 RepID=A0A7Y9I791_9ACTN|nr:DUF6098 family protein [Microlunatus parietis]NYE71574.1 hypothetical protein [Microlunatus parietis]